MKKISILSIIFLVCFTSCSDWLEREPTNIISPSKAYSSRGAVNSVIADLYYNLPDLGGLQDVTFYTYWDEGISGGYVSANNIINYSGTYASYYDYGMVRKINSHIRDIQEVKFLSSDEMKYYVAEARFIRAYVYFEMVKRMGGVPLITEVMAPVAGKEPEDYAVARSKEYEIYDFIASELDAIKEDLNLARLQYNRASKGAAIAMKIRAMLYAGSLAKNNSEMPLPVTLPGGEVGIPSEMANGYFQKALDAFIELENMGVYGLYDSNSDKTANFNEALTKAPAENKEIIFVKDFSDIYLHNWTANNLSRTMRYGGIAATDGGSACNPTLNLVDEFERTDGSDPKLKAYTDPNHPDEIGQDNVMDTNPGAYVYYNDLQEIFANKDPRLFATVITPGQSFAGKSLDIQAGFAYYNTSTSTFQFEVGTFTNLAGNYFIVGTDTITDNTGNILLKTGYDGPARDAFVSHTGFYVRKFMEENPRDAFFGSKFQSIRYRYGEAVLNAAEAAFELGKTNEALGYLNQIRSRAGLPQKAAISLKDIRNERRIELALESDHRYFDLKRWRIAHEIFDGSTATPTAMMYGLWPYKVYRPGHETHDKWIYVRRVNTAVISDPRRFILSNYYTYIPSDALVNNYKLVKNPGQ